MPIKKYSKEFKLEVINYYKNNPVGFTKTANHFNIPSSTTVQEWIRKYNIHGEKGLRENTAKYDGKFRKYVVEYMYKNHLSLTETAMYFNIGHRDNVKRWKEIYQNKGAQALYFEESGRKKVMKKNQKISKKKLEEMSHKELLKEYEKVRAENAYLKKLSALIQERTKLKKKKR